jgi:hypothetical protein
MDQDDPDALQLTQVALTELGGGQPPQKKVVHPRKVESNPFTQDSPQKDGKKGSQGAQKMDAEVLKAS